MAERCAEAEEFWLPINVNTGRKVGDCILVCVKAKEEGARIGEAAAFVTRVYDRLHRAARSGELVRKLDVLLGSVARVSGDRVVETQMMAGLPDGEFASEVGVLVVGVALWARGRGAGHRGRGSSPGGLCEGDAAADADRAAVLAHRGGAYGG